MERYLVHRPKDTVEVWILPHKSNQKYSFVNVTKGHICECQFDTIEEALADMDKQIRLGKVLGYTKIE